MASEEQLVFAMDLEASGLKSGANDSADALEQLRNAIQSGTEDLRAMQAAMRNLKGSTLASDETVQGLKDRISATKATLQGNTLELVKSGRAFEKQPKAINSAADALKAQQTASKSAAQALKLHLAEGLKRSKEEAEDLKKQLAPMTDLFGKWKGLVGAGGIALGLVAIAGAMVAMVAAAAAATAALLGYTIAQADARRSDLLRLEGLSKVRNYWLEMVTGQRRAADSASYLQKTIDGVASQSALSRDRVGELTTELYTAGLRGARLKQALEGMAVVEATQGREQAAMFKARALGAYIYGTSIKKLSDDVKARLGGVAKAQMLSLDVQTRKLKENVSHLFDNIKIERFLEGLSKITDLMSQNTAIGRALKTLLEVVFQPMIDGAAKAAPLVKKFFQGIIIGALYVAIAVLKIRNAIRDAFGGKEAWEGLDLGTLAMQAGMAAAIGLAVTTAVLTAALAGLVGVAAAAAYGVYTLAKPFIWVMQKGGELAAWVASTDWIALGTTITSGIAAGIKSGAIAVMSAMRNLGSEAIKAFKQKLGIASPSRVAFRTSLAIPQGIVQAQEAGRVTVKASAIKLGAATEEGMRAGQARTSTTPQRAPAAPVVSPIAAPRASAPGGASSSAARPPMVIQIENLTVGGGMTKAETHESLRQAVEELFEVTARVVGAGASF
jgi:hypothetical protein